MHRHLCGVRGCIVQSGESNPVTLPLAPPVWPKPSAPVVLASVNSYRHTRIGMLDQSSSSTSQLLRWIRVSSSRAVRARSSARARSAATGNADSVRSSERE